MSDFFEIDEPMPPEEVRKLLKSVPEAIKIRTYFDGEKMFAFFYRKSEDKKPLLYVDIQDVSFAAHQHMESIADDLSAQLMAEFNSAKH